MGIPNTTPATALPFSTLPTTITQDYGTDLEGWYSYTGHAGEVIAGFWAHAAIPGDSLTTTVFESDGTTQFLGLAALNVPMQVPQSDGTLLYFRVVASAPLSTDVTFSAVPGPTNTVPVGAIFVNDETTGFATGCVSADDGADYAVLQFFNMAITASENGGDVLENGRFLVASDDDSTYRLYDGQLALVTTVSGLVNPVFTSIKTCVGAQVFYVCKRIAHTITRVDGDGLVTDTWNTGLACIAASASNDELVIYVTQGTTIKQWNPNTDSFDADLVAGIATYLTTDLLVIGDGKILALYTKSAAAVVIKCYDAAGTTLHTYTLGTTTSSEASLFHAIDDPTSFWTRVHDVVAAKTCTFYNIRVSDGTILATVTQASYNDGTYLDAATLTPSARFGLSTSCPSFILREAINPVPPGDPVSTLIRRERIFRHLSDEQQWIFYQSFQLDIEAGVGLSTGQGSDPEVEVQWSDDGGHTWSNIHILFAGKQGEYSRRAILKQALGRSRDRVWKVSMSDPVRWALINAYFTAERGSS